MNGKKINLSCLSENFQVMPNPSGTFLGLQGIFWHGWPGRGEHPVSCLPWQSYEIHSFIQLSVSVIVSFLPERHSLEL